MSAYAMIAILNSDVFAVAMLSVIFCSFGVIGLLVWSMKRNVARRDRHVDDLLEELAEEKRNRGATPTASHRAEWEKEADWWKQSDS